MSELIVEAVPPPPLATLSQLKAQITVTRNVHDDELELYLQAASNVVRRRVVVDEARVPAEVTLATLVIAEHLWETQRGDASRPGFDDDGLPDRASLLRGFALPRRAEQLLAGLPSTRSGPLGSFPDPVAYPVG